MGMKSVELRQTCFRRIEKKPRGVAVVRSVVLRDTCLNLETNLLGFESGTSKGGCIRRKDSAVFDNWFKML
jgi:hypothetical protein